MKKILYITTIPSPYRVAYFNELGKKCDLTVLFEKAGSDERDAVWRQYKFDNFKGIILPGKKLSVNTAFCPTILKYLKITWDEIVCCDISTLTGMLAIQYMKLKKIKYWIEGDGAFAKSGKGFKEQVKKHFISGAYGYFSTSKLHDEYYVTYGADMNKIRRYMFSSVVDSRIINLGNGEVSQQIEKRDTLRIQARRELGMEENDIIVLTIGQFIHRKGFDILLNAAKMLDKKIKLYFVGGIPTDEYKNLCKKNQLRNIYFEGFKNSDILAKYYTAADIFVLPTREDVWGLVVNEAMSYALPVITTTKCIAGLEMVKDNYNGFLVEPDNIIDLANKINKIALNKELRDKCTINAINIGKLYTIEAMVETHNVLYAEE